MVRGFRAKLGVFGILGNHDLHRMAPHLRRTPMDLIDGARREIPFGDDGTVIEIIGLPGVDREELTEEFLYSFPRRRENTLRVVLSHHPDHFPRVRYALEPDLFLLVGDDHPPSIRISGWDDASEADIAACQRLQLERDVLEDVRKVRSLP